MLKSDQASYQWVFPIIAFIFCWIWRTRAKIINFVSKCVVHIYRSYIGYIGANGTNSFYIFTEHQLASIELADVQKKMKCLLFSRSVSHLSTSFRWWYPTLYRILRKFSKSYFRYFFFHRNQIFVKLKPIHFPLISWISFVFFILFFFFSFMWQSATEITNFCA